MRPQFWPALLVLTVLSLPGDASDSTIANPKHDFEAKVRPFLKTYCLACHTGEKAKGDLDLSIFENLDQITKDLRPWQAVLEQLDTARMPPQKAKQHPPAPERQEIVAWLRALRADVAKRNAGDPGPVPPRRLSNAEYDNTIRDLTGVDIRPAREFPVDPANESGFDNSAESLAMSPALLNKYIAAARLVSEHVLLMPQGLTFAPFPVIADTDRDKYGVRRIIDFYHRQKTDYADYFEAAWRYQHRAALGKPSATLTDVAAEAGLSARYLTRLWEALTGPADEVGPIAALRALWQALPSPDGKQGVARPGSEQMRDFIVRLRPKLVPEVKNLIARPMQNGSQPLVLWKNRQVAANRLRYAGGGLQMHLEKLAPNAATAPLLMAPMEDVSLAKTYEHSLGEFCALFPDTFYVSERARVYLDPEKEKKLSGRLLSAGFHSMTGYFRDDGPLYELMLDKQQQKELDDLWLEFDVITGAPFRQYTSFIWFERTDSSFMRGEEFESFRAEDKASTSEEKIKKLAEVYLAKVRRMDASPLAQEAVMDHFAIIDATIRRVEKTRLAAEPSHVKALQAFAERAFRRPLSRAETDDVAAFYRVMRDQDGLSHEDAVRDTLVRLLISPNFLFRAEAASVAAAPAAVGPPAKQAVQRLTDYDLANRMSYFLWSSMPDAELLGHARAGDLHQPNVLADQARRMVRDERVRALATEFAGNWLDFRRFEEHNAVDRERFPSFTDDLRRAMFEEPVRFVVDAVRADRSVLDFLYGKHTFVNPILAKHYGIPIAGLGADVWARVDDASAYGRGGLLPMAVFLTKNAPGLRTSPVKRGYWVVRRVLGEKIPAPPATVPELPADEAKLGEVTLREVLASHRADKSCAGCHERFDGVGLVFEGYGPIGERRTKDLGDRPVDDHAAFPGGSEGVGLEGLRAYLRGQRQDEFVDNLCRKLLAFALGRTLLPSDDSLVEDMRRQLASNDYRFSTMIDAIITSPQFLNKRASGS